MHLFYVNFFFKSSISMFNDASIFVKTGFAPQSIIASTVAIKLNGCYYHQL